MSKQWANSERRKELPANWYQLREARKKLAEGRCEAMSQIDDLGRISMVGTRCIREGSECDHHVHRDDHRLESLRWLCGPHHRRKTQAESLAARTRKPPPRDTEPHPGRIRHEGKTAPADEG